MTVEVENAQPVTYSKTLTITSILRLREGGAPLVVTSGTFTLQRPDASTLSTGVTVDDGGDPTFVVVPGDWIAGDPFGIGYSEHWVLTTAGGVITVQRPALCSLSVPVIPFSDLDMERMHSGILAEAPDGSDPNVPADPAWSGKREQAWRRLQSRTQQGIVDTTAVASWFSFLDYLVYDSLWLTCQDLSTEERGSGKWTLAADRYALLREEEWTRVLFDIDRDRDGVADTDGPSQVSAVGHGGHPGNRRW